MHALSIRFPSLMPGRMLLAALFVVAVGLGSALIGGCASTALQQEKIALDAVTSARQVCTANLRAAKITIAQDQTCQTRLDLTRTAIQAAAAAGNATQVAQGKATADAIAADPSKALAP